ncbi:MAG: tungstate ABC transporter [Chloroflexota bacterium]|nr:MAG: tungstate ABC transporter [Chloroflexota bacterium]
MKHFSFALILLALLAVSAGCAAPAPTTVPLTVAPVVQATQVPAAAPTDSGQAAACALRLATTTSTADSGLLDAILPAFEKQFNCKVDVVAVGTGQALEIGSKGDADVVLVHARSQEDKFVKEGNAQARFDVMYNDFILVGPKSDPANVSGAATAKEAFKLIADTQSPFASRGDKSGTNTKELAIWASAGITPTKEMKWYNSLGQGMGETLIASNEGNFYTLADRGTWLAMKDKLPNLAIVFGGETIDQNPDKVLYNPYGVMAVNPDKFPTVNAAMASNFVQWILSPETQAAIGKYGQDKFGQALFYANAAK